MKGYSGGGLGNEALVEGSYIGIGQNWAPNPKGVYDVPIRTVRETEPRAPSPNFSSSVNNNGVVTITRKIAKPFTFEATMSVSVQTNTLIGPVVEGGIAMLAGNGAGGRPLTFCTSILDTLYIVGSMTLVRTVDAPTYIFSPRAQFITGSIAANLFVPGTDIFMTIKDCTA